MSDLDYQSERDPIFWLRGHPIRAATLLVIIHTACLLICTFVFAAQNQAVLGFLAFSTTDFLRGFVYTPLTYGLVHIPADVIGFAFEMFILWSFGGQVEQFFGRRIFLQLYGLLWLLPPLVLLAFHSFGPQVSMGAGTTHLAVFVAFAAIYPGARVYFDIKAFWIAVILVAAYSIMHVANRDIPLLITLWATVAASWYFVAWQRGEWQVRLPSFLQPKPKFRVLPKPAAPLRSVPPPPKVHQAMADVDSLLDKIARSGLSSLTPEERARLEQASADLKKNP